MMTESLPTPMNPISAISSALQCVLRREVENSRKSLGMPFFEWDDRFNVGIHEIDEQHKNLVALVNGLFESISQGEDAEMVHQVVDELVEYIWVHFQTEEKLLKDAGYPEYRSHQHGHKLLVRDVVKLQQRLAEGDVQISVEVGEFLKNWVIGHIMVSDQRYGPFLKTASGN